jgi:hypothetical protein
VTIERSARREWGDVRLDTNLGLRKESILQMDPESQPPPLQQPQGQAQQHRSPPVASQPPSSEGEE